MTYSGKIRNGVVVFDDSLSLPEGIDVRVEVIQGDPEPADEGLPRMLDFVGDAGVADLSANIDHYLYGHPKVTDVE